MKDLNRVKTYRNILNWNRFRLRLVWEGILSGLFAGVVIGFYRYVLQFLETNRHVVYDFLKTNDWYMTAGWFAILMIIAFILQWLIKYEPMSGGSGIPQVNGVILGFMKMNWAKIMKAKIVGGILGIGAGLSLGREGPSIQIGAVAAQAISRLFGRTKMEERYLITSGASAGLAAAFNAPLAGVIFSLEELHHNFSAVVLLPAMAASMVATTIINMIFGRSTIFNFGDLPAITLNYIPQTILLGLIIGFIGAFFNYGLIKSGELYQSKLFPNTFSRTAFALFFAGILGFFLPEVLGGGNELVDSLAHTPLTLQFLLVLLASKFLFTMISYGCGVPGGFFLPMLVIGALSGSVISNIMVSVGVLDPFYSSNMIIFAMAAFFAASVRAPITGTILITEMTSSLEHLFPLVIVSLCAYLTAEVCKSKPIYSHLLEIALQKRKQKINSNERPSPDNNARSVIEAVVNCGSVVDGRLIKHIRWPQGTLLVDIKRGGNDLIPNGETEIRAGDYLYILTHINDSEKVRNLITESKYKCPEEVDLAKLETAEIKRKIDHFNNH